MLTLIIGRAGTGKTEELLRRARAGGSQRPQVLLVPDQYSHETERRLCQTAGAEASLYAEVLSFTRLSNRVFAENGGLNLPQLDNGGRLLLMHRAVRSVQGQLTVYARPSGRASFLSSLIAAHDELTEACVRPEHLLQAAEHSENGGKLRDLSLILSAYEAETAQRAADPRDRLTRLADALADCTWFAGKDVYADGFTDFTPQEQRVMRHVLRQAESVTMAVTCGDWDAKSQRMEYEPARRTIASMVRLAESAGVACRTETWDAPRQGWIPELNWLERAYCGGNAPWEAPTDAVELYTGETPFDQTEFAAGKILELVREHGLRWREIGVTVRSLDAWEDEIDAVFRRYGVPINLNRMTDILQKPVLSLLISALNAVTSGYRYEDMFRYLKTGLTGVTPEECDLLENYVLLWDIRGAKWTAEAAWSGHPDGYAQPWTDAQRQEVARLDALRRRIAAPLQHLQNAPGETGLDRARAIYAFLEEIGLRTRLEEQAQALTERGSLTQAEEYAQLWEILCEALDQCAQLLADERISLPDFSQLLQLVLSQYRVGSIPASLDRVTVGDAARMAHRNLKCLIILGAEDTAFPRITENTSLLTDEDRAVLSELGMKVGLSAGERAEREMTLLYDLVSLPRELLVVCRSEHGAAGEVQRPSILFTRLEACFPNCVHVSAGQRKSRYRLSAPIPALDELAETRDPALLSALKALEPTADRAARLERAFDAAWGSLSPDAVRTLYSDTIRLSASRMDRMNQCHFSYFMDYGLKARPRKEADFDAPTMGTFVHDVLEQVLKAAKARGGVKCCSDQDLIDLTEAAVERYIREELGGLDDKDRRFQYLFRRLLNGVDQVVRNVADELCSSDFEPIAFELGFGRPGETPLLHEADGITLSITGFVDRVDGWVQNNRLYFRVVDYKTGKKSFDFTDIRNGLGLQMLIYLFALQKSITVLQESGMAPSDAEKLIPAGVLYLPARDAAVSGPSDMSSEALQKELDKELKRSGLVLNKDGVPNAMEHRADGEAFRFLPIKVTKATKKKPEELTGDALVTAEQLGLLERHVESALDQIARDFSEGNVKADPYSRGTSSPCSWCSFKAACQFEEGQRGNKRHYVASVKAKDFWKILAAEPHADSGRTSSS